MCHFRPGTKIASPIPDSRRLYPRVRLYKSVLTSAKRAPSLIITIRNPENPLTTISSSLAYWVCGHVSLFVREDNGSLPTRTTLVLLACLIMQIPDIIYHLTWEARCPINCVREIIKPS